MRLINALEAGTLTGGDLASLVSTDPTRATEMGVLLGSRGQARRLALSDNAFAAILLASGASVDALVRNEVAQAEIRRAPRALAAIQADALTHWKFALAVMGVDPAIATDVPTAQAAAASFRSDALSHWRLLLAIAGFDPSIATSVPAAEAALSASRTGTKVVIDSGASLDIELMLLAPSFVTASDTAHGAASPVWGVPVREGYFGGINTVGANNFAIIIAPKALGEHAGTVRWKTSNDASANTGDDDDGLANANAQNNATHPLFQWARGLTINGKTDWAPPAKNPISVIAAKLRSGVTSNPLFQPGGPEAFESANYWSATQHPSNTNNAWYVNFSSGSVSYNGKNAAYRARVVRRVSL